MTRTTCAMLLVFCFSGPALASSEQGTVELTLDLVDGSRIVGTPQTDTLPLSTSYATVEIPFPEIKSMKIKKDHERVRVELRGGDRLTGALGMKQFTMSTILGTLKVRTIHIKKISVRAGQSPDTNSGLVLHYSFDEDFAESGKVKAETGEGPALSVSGPSVTSVPDGIEGRAVQFKGGSLSCDSNPTAGMKDATLSIWFKTANPKANYKLASAAWWRGGRNASGWVMGTHYPESWADNQIPFFVEGETVIKPGRKFNANEWNHLVITFNSEELKEYINGELYQTSQCTGQPFGKGANLTLGNWMNIFPYHGLIDEFMVFDRALSAEEVQDLYGSTPAVDSSDKHVPKRTAPSARLPDQPQRGFAVQQ